MDAVYFVYMYIWNMFVLFSFHNIECQVSGRWSQVERICGCSRYFAPSKYAQGMPDARLPRGREYKEVADTPVFKAGKHCRNFRMW